MASSTSDSQIMWTQLLESESDENSNVQVIKQEEINALRNSHCGSEFYFIGEMENSYYSESVVKILNHLMTLQLAVLYWYMYNGWLTCTDVYAVVSWLDYRIGNNILEHGDCRATYVMGCKVISVPSLVLFFDHSMHIIKEYHIIMITIPQKLGESKAKALQINCTHSHSM